jgi:hypothetical protein
METYFIGTILSLPTQPRQKGKPKGFLMTYGGEMISLKSGKGEVGRLLSASQKKSGLTLNDSVKGYQGKGVVGLSLNCPLGFVQEQNFARRER